MMRRYVTLSAMGIGLALVCGGGCEPEGVGDPCTPEVEYDATFAGFSEKEVYVESKSFQCRTRVCLVNHFRGRKSCPYGTQAGAPDCKTPVGDPIAAGVDVSPQCNNRQDDKAVYCSCRCANVNGKTDDGSVYCTCPDGFECSQLVTSIGSGDTGLTGSYCVKSGTAFKDVCTPDCNPSEKNCETAK